MTGVPHFDHAPGRETDVCLMVEGCYPHVAGGVSTWVDWLIRSQPDLTFSVVSIVSGAETRTRRYEPPPNLLRFDEIALHGAPARRGRRLRRTRADVADALAPALTRLIREGALADLDETRAVIAREALSHHDLVDSELTWALVTRMYAALMPQASFLAFHWAWRSLVGGLFAVLTAPAPRARVYHATCTGYAGLLAARAARETGRNAVLTEHGVYANERRIELLMADWIPDQIDKGAGQGDDRLDLRDLWMTAFQSYGKLCYEACAAVTTLYGDNRLIQEAFGAPAEKLRVIPNGIDVEAFAALERRTDPRRPTVALIGRVVPIKDVKTFVAAAALMKRLRMNIHALVLGPTDEDPDYFAACAALARDLDVADSVTFTGRVPVMEWLPKIDVVVLSSLSEAQPLTLLEAGAAGVPCVATDVGACREIIEGHADEDPPFGRGGFIADLVSPETLAHCVLQLLDAPRAAREMGANLRARVRAHYGAARAQAAYRDLYSSLATEAS